MTQNDMSQEERVAKVIAEARCQGHSWDTHFDDFSKDEYRASARAAISAMEATTEAAVQAERSACEELKPVTDQCEGWCEDSNRDGGKGHYLDCGACLIIAAIRARNAKEETS